MWGRGRGEGRAQYRDSAGRSTRSARVKVSLPAVVNLLSETIKTEVLEPSGKTDVRQAPGAESHSGKVNRVSEQVGSIPRSGNKLRCRPQHDLLNAYAMMAITHGFSNETTGFHIDTARSSQFDSEVFGWFLGLQAFGPDLHDRHDTAPRRIGKATVCAIQALARQLPFGERDRVRPDGDGVGRDGLLLRMRERVKGSAAGVFRSGSKLKQRA